MQRPPPILTRKATPVPYTTLFRWCGPETEHLPCEEELPAALEPQELLLLIADVLTRARERHLEHRDDRRPGGAPGGGKCRGPEHHARDIDGVEEDRKSTRLNSSH